ncbi:transmembrane protein [Bosea sp. BIWAKO-01]|nr:transmembrane protein [Bosea sp. BIWAKO-01]
MSYWPSLFGGMLIGLSAALLLLLNGRIAGISGIVGRLAQGAQVPANAAFLIGSLPVRFSSPSPSAAGRR